MPFRIERHICSGDICQPRAEPRPTVLSYIIKELTLKAGISGKHFARDIELMGYSY
jgi:hypothetical protein